MRVRDVGEGAEEEERSGGKIKRALTSVIGSADELGLLSEGELGDTLVPSLDDSSNTLYGTKRSEEKRGRRMRSATSFPSSRSDGL